MQFKPIWQALPSWSYSQKCLRTTGFKEEDVKRAKSPFTSFLFELFAFGTLLNISNAERQWCAIHTWPAILRIPWCRKETNVYDRIPTDGTFNQRAPLRRLVGAMHCYSYDLSAATDRWPLRIIFTIVMYLFDISFASAVVNNCFANNDFLPLGYYLSWALFALTHHDMVGRRKGDDVLIVDQHVGLVYKSFIDDIGVKISTPKSIVLNTGCVEFTKRFS
ncbi:hypothetical protein M9H77_23588 [Catharanthus roseus]|uniref:Uncharacterized protein n=1 Tax=Catharanthus roseus TaxID=4058 RepID=A0ACC0AVG7_CATRO|nr:hypothetical protein M9H77_23588 [Catharanthus roseus]